MAKKKQPSFLITFSSKDKIYYDELCRMAEREAETRDDPNFSKNKYAKRVVINHIKTLVLINKTT